MSLPPIIKIKRGSGVPTPAGITAGEFAFNKTGNILYIGACGGYTGYDGSSSLGTRTTSNNDLNIIPIGMQISNDPEMGAGADIDLRAGYSNFTVPTTKAVRDWVNQTKMNQVLGATFRAGPGIGITSDQDPGSTQYNITISNTGVIKGFTGFNVIGNAFGDVVKAKSAIDGITFIGGGGIALRSSNADGSLLIQNYGVTSIGGFTGDISTFSPIVNLTGFTAGIGLAVRQVVTTGSGSPLEITPASFTGTEGISRTGIEISHTNSGLGSAVTHTGILNGVPQLLDLNVNLFGHVTGYSSVPLNFANVLPLGFTEAVQDAAYPGLTGIVPYGIQYVYDDGANPGVLRTINRGITSIFTTGVAGLSGPVKFEGDTIITILAEPPKSQMTFGYAGKQYANFAAKLPPSVSYPSGSGIYIGGATGPGLQTLAAATSNSTLTAIAGRGIGICMGVQNLTDTMLIWNTGVNRISAYNSGSVLLGGTGFSGNIDLVAGTNVVFSRGSGSTDNTLTISSTGGGGGGAVSWIQGDYTTATSPPEDFEGTYTGDGITGAISISGLNGILTIQDTGSNGSPSTNNGSLFIGLGSNVYIRPKIADTPVYPNVGEFNSEIVIATARESGIPNLPTISYLENPQNYSRLVTDTIEGGFTGAFSYGAGNGSFNPLLPNLFDEVTSYPGKILSLRAREGLMDTTASPGSVSFGGVYAELRLLGYPNPESMSAYINEIYDHTTAGDNITGCPNGNCIGYPAVLPPCNIGLDEFGQKIYYHTDGTGEFDTTGDGDGAVGQLRGTAVFHSNVVARDSLFVKKDIWLTGELIDATTGCLYAAGAGGGTNVFNGGNLGLTGDLIVQGSIYVHGTTAFFNVADLSTESPLIRIGGISASNGTEEMGPLILGQANRFGDRGLLLFSFNSIPYSPLFTTSSRAAANITNFIGIDQDDGVFKYIIDATTLRTNNGALDYTIINSGRLGPAKFSEINNVGITSDNATISLRTGSGTPNPTKIDLSGHVAITAATSSGLKANITLGNSAKVSFGSAGDIAVIDFPRGITFYPNIITSDFEGGTAFNGGQAAVSASTNNLRIRYAPDNIAPRTISIRNPGVNKFAQLVDNGKWAANDNQNPAGTIDADRQMIYNKTLGDGTIIDCGTY